MILETKPEKNPLPDRQWFQDLIQRANDGDQKAQQELRETLADHPELAIFAGDLGRHAMDHLIRTIAGSDIALREAIEAEALLEELAGPKPTRHREMLAKHVVCC